MIELGKMVARTAISILIVALVLGFPNAVSAADEETQTEAASGISKQRISEAVATLSASGDYTYEEATFEDPAWLRRFKAWVARMGDRWESSPLNPRRTTPYSLVGVVLLLLLVVGAAGLLLTRVMAAEPFRPRGSGGLVGGEAGGAGRWEEADESRAAELAASGRLREAVSALFASLLRGLDSSGWIRYRRGRASRAYLRQLRRSAELYPLFRDFLGRFEIVYYRKGDPDQDDWRFLRGVYVNLAHVAAERVPPAYMRRT